MVLKLDDLIFKVLPHYEKEKKQGKDGYKGELGLFTKYNLRSCLSLVRKNIKENVVFDEDLYEEIYFLSREHELKYKLCDPEFRAKYDFLK